MRLSLRRRLLTTSAATTLVIVGGAAVFVWLLMLRSLRQSLDQSLQTQALTFAAHLEEDRGRVEFEIGKDSLKPGLFGTDALVKIVGDDGRCIFASAELTEAASLAPPASKAAVGDLSWFDARLGKPDLPFRAIALYAAVSPDDEHAASRDHPTPLFALIMVARPLAPLTSTLNRLAAVLIIAVIAAGGAALVFGVFVSRSGIKPVRDVVTGLRGVRPEQPTLALDRQVVPIELDPIVETVESLLARIRQELARQRQLTADVAHDLRTPLAGVRTLLDVVLQKPRDSNEYVDTLRKAQAALRQLSDLVDGVLTLARLEAQIDQPQLATVSVQDVTDAALAAVRPLADVRGVALRADVPAGLTLRSDRSKLTKILNNLMTNAVEHSPAGQAVVVTAAQDATSTRIAVEDRGPGVAAQMRDQIFERFVRGDASRTSDGHHGLGLPIARGLARLLGGDVTLENNDANSTRFVLRLRSDVT